MIADSARKIRAVRPDITEHDLIIEMAFLVNAKLALSLIGKLGAHVSVELHPDTALRRRSRPSTSRGDTMQIEPDYFYIKVPLTPDGFIATRLLSGEGIPVNYTLGFSARQNYLAARFAKPMFVNVFLGRLNSLVEENGLGKPDNVGEKATLASNEAFRGLREAYRDIPTSQIAASMRSGAQVAGARGRGCVHHAAQGRGGVPRDGYLQRRYPPAAVGGASGGAYRHGPWRVMDTLWNIDEEFIAFR